MPQRSRKFPPRRSRPVQLADTIKEWVVEHQLKAGDRLPGEAELIESHGRSKGTVREAMRILEAQGLVETRTGPGGGSFVAEVSPDRAQSLLANFFYFRDLSIKDIYQIRKLLEPEVAATLAGKLSDEQLAALEAVGTYDPCRDGDTIVFDRVDRFQGSYARFEIYTLDFETGIERRLTHGARAREPACSPDGRWAAAVQITEGRTRLIRIDLSDGRIEDVKTALLLHWLAANKDKLL